MPAHRTIARETASVQKSPGRPSHHTYRVHASTNAATWSPYSKLAGRQWNNDHLTVDRAQQRRAAHVGGAAPPPQRRSSRLTAHLLASRQVRSTGLRQRRTAIASGAAPTHKLESGVGLDFAGRHQQLTNPAPAAGAPYLFRLEVSTVAALGRARHYLAGSSAALRMAATPGKSAPLVCFCSIRLETLHSETRTPPAKSVQQTVRRAVAIQRPTTGQRTLAVLGFRKSIYPIGRLDATPKACCIER